MSQSNNMSDDHIDNSSMSPNSTTDSDTSDSNDSLIKEGSSLNAAELYRQVLQSNNSSTQDNLDIQMDSDSLDTDTEGLKYMESDIEETTSLSIALDNAMALETIRDFIRFCVTQLRTYDIVIAQGSNDVFAEASAIVLHTLNLEWSADEQILDCRLTQLEKSAILDLLQQRIESRKPLSYLINLAYFCGLPFYVDERVLIPRSPIAEMIRQQFYPYFQVNQLAQPLNTQPLPNHVSKNKTTVAAEAYFDHGLPNKQLAQPSHILDLCTGSGCIAIAMATRFPEAQVDATDIDQDALQVAYINAEHHELDYQINLIESDLFAKLPSDEQYDLIVTNPPYVDAASMAELPPEFLYEPEHALAAGQDGLDLVHRILHAAPDYLSEDGLLICEVGDSEWALSQAYPQIDFNWLTFALGGSGIFAIDKAALLEYRALFAKYVAVLDDRAS